MMAFEQAIKQGEAAFGQQLQDRARVQGIPIDQVVWQHPANSDTAELTGVRNRKAYIFSLPCHDLTDLHRSAVRQETVRFLLTAIKENIPLGRRRREKRRV